LERARYVGDETLTEGERAVHPACLVSGTGTDNAVSRNLPVFYKRAFRFWERPDAEDAVQDALLSLANI